MSGAFREWVTLGFGKPGPTKESADSVFPACKGCGAVLLQEHAGQLAPERLEIIWDAGGLWLQCPACGCRENVLDWQLVTAHDDLHWSN